MSLEKRYSRQLKVAALPKLEALNVHRDIESWLGFSYSITTHQPPKTQKKTQALHPAHLVCILRGLKP
jgi:hypothetical protein